MLRLLVALDFSDCSRHALHTALAVARRATPCHVTLLTVLDARSAEAAARDDALREVEQAVAQLNKLLHELVEARGEGPLPAEAHTHFMAVRGAAAEQIVAAAQSERADAVIMGTHGRTGLDRLLVGSVAETVVRLAPCSVLTVKPPKK